MEGHLADSTGAPLRLVDLLAERELDLRLLTGADPNTRIRGAHAMEIPNPTRWLQPGWLMLTTGTRFTGNEHCAGHRGTENEQRALVRELRSSGIAGLGFGEGVVLERVPPALLAEADRLGFPLLAVPLATPFLDVVTRATRANLAGEGHTVHRTVTIQDFLMESVAAIDATAELVRRLGELLHASVVVFGEDGKVRASTGAGPTRLIRADIARNATQHRRFTVGRWTVVTTPVHCGTELCWLSVAARHDLPVDVTTAALEAVRRVLTLIVRSQSAARDENRLRRAEPVRQVADGQVTDNRALWERLEMYRFRADNGLRLLAVSGPGPDTLERAAIDVGVRLLLDSKRNPALGLAEGEEAALGRWVRRIDGDLRCGVSDRFGDPANGRHHARQAEVALQAAEREGTSVVWFRDVGLVDWLVAAGGVEESREKARRTLEPVLAHPLLHAALASYLSHGQDVGRTARHLAIHPNSVRYRLRRVGELTGRDPRRPQDLAELAVATRLLAAGTTP